MAAAAYARTIPALAGTDEVTLRDHLPLLLTTISADMCTDQSRTESIAKSHGHAPDTPELTPAETHGLLRAQRGISIEQLVAEFRALRSSVLRLWMDQQPIDASAVEEIARFNEAIDQAVAESVRYYAEERERWRQIFLGVLGHDLRGPLNSISLTVELMRRQVSAPAAQTSLLSRAVKRLTSLLDSLLEYNRAGLGSGMNLNKVNADVAVACSEEVELLRAAHEAAEIQVSSTGDTMADVDASRVREAVSNLVSNAVKHGQTREPILVAVEGLGPTVRVTVQNSGDIPQSEIEFLFEPMRQRETASASSDRTHLGLGLFIVRQIARAHGGEATGSSRNGRVTFTVEFPKDSTRPREN